MMERRGLIGPPHSETETLLLWLNTVSEPTCTWHNSNVSRQRGTNCNKQRQSTKWPSSAICPSSSPTTRLMCGPTAISSNSMTTGMPEVVAGVPPDYFSEGGQKWGTVLYRWDAHQRDGWRWWRERMKRMLRLFDIVRIDHFRAVHSNWAIPTEDEDARHGWWQDGPADELMEALIDASGEPGRLLAEDLGIIPEEVVALRRRFNLPGMAVLQFGFDGNPSNPHHPDNIQSGPVVYTGTHDNNTTHGWWMSLDDETKQRVHHLLQPDETPTAGLMRLAKESDAAMAMFPLQDVLGLGEEARMNTPGTFEGNWRWAFAWSDLPE